MRQRIRIKERLPIWGLRLILGVILMTLSELVMWQNPPAHGLADWPFLLILYIALASIMMDLIVRFQARELPELLIISGLYGMASSAVVSHSAFDNLPFSLIIRGLGLQTGAGLYGLMLFITVMRGKSINVIQAASAVGVGILWGIWVHWYPIQARTQWGEVPLQTAQFYMLPALVLIGILFAVVAPRFRFIREQQMELLWWEAIIVAIPLFITLIVGMLQTNPAGEIVIPVLPLIIMIVIGACIVWALFYQRGGYEPSILAQILYVAPNTITFIMLAIAFLIAGTVTYTLVNGPDSPVGIGMYWLVFAFGSGWIPLASLLIFWRYYRKRNEIELVDEDEDAEDAED
jgi:hypothetical protein